MQAGQKSFSWDKYLYKYIENQSPGQEGSVKRVMYLSKETLLWSFKTWKDTSRLPLCAAGGAKNRDQRLFNFTPCNPPNQSVNFRNIPDELSD
jgi:hypothetical protein